MKTVYYYTVLIGMLLIPQMSCAQKSLPGYDQARAWAPQVAENYMFSYTIRPNYFPQSSSFWYSFKTTQGEKWYVVNPQSGSKQPLWDNDEMAARLTELTHDPYDAQHLPIERMSLKKGSSDTFLFSVGKKQFEYNYRNHDLQVVQTARPERPGFGNESPDKKWVVYGKSYNLYSMTAEDYAELTKNKEFQPTSEKQLTHFGEKDFSFVMRWESTISDGGPLKDTSGERSRVMGYWSPDSRYYVQTVTDQRDIKDLWVINSIAEPRPTLETYKYQMPGEKGTTTHLYIADIETQQVKEVKTAKYPNQSLSIISGHQRRDFSKEGSSTWKGEKDCFYITRMSRDQKRMDVCTYTLGQDSIVPVLHREMNTYMDTRVVGVVNGGKQFILYSEEDGWSHLYLYNKDGSLAKRLTKGAWHVDNILAIDEAQKVIYFNACGREKGDTTPYNTHTYRVNLDGSGLRLLTPGDYFHLCYMDEQKQYIVDNYSRVNTIPAISIYNTQGQKVMDLEKADMSQLFAHGYQFPTPIKTKAADGVTDLYGVMYKPFDMDSTRTYPVIDYVYPGPQQEGNFFRFCPMNPRTDRLAQAGFIVVAIGQRGGSPKRSKWYHNFGYGNLRDYPLEDHKVSIEQLCTRYKFMDVNRVGIHGHSGGGFMSTAAMLVYPDFFKVAVSCAGNHDNNIYNRNWSERHHGVQELTDENGDTRFDIRVPANQDLAANLKGHLLLIHGDVDNNVHPGNTIRVVDALIKAGKRFDMLIMPGKQHHFEDYNEYFYWKMVDYFSEHLKGARETSVDIRGIKLGKWFQGYQD